jgi:hypothetical protein
MNSDLHAKIKQIVTDYEGVAYPQFGTAGFEDEELHDKVLDAIVDDIIETTYTFIKEGLTK